MKYATFCPLFPGFYGTIFEYDREDDDINSYNEEHNTSLTWDDFNWDFKDYEQRVCKAFVNKLETELKHFLPIKIVMESIYSPKEYNFSNDSINVTVSLSLDRLIKLIKDRENEATIYFRDHYTSRSGFISFHSNRFNDWINKKYILENPDHRIGALLDCLSWCEIDIDNIYYWCDGEFYINYAPIEETV